MISGNRIDNRYGICSLHSSNGEKLGLRICRRYRLFSDDVQAIKQAPDHLTIEVTIYCTCLASSKYRLCPQDWQAPVATFSFCGDRLVVVNSFNQPESLSTTDDIGRSQRRITRRSHIKRMYSDTVFIGPNCDCQTWPNPVDDD